MGFVIIGIICIIAGIVFAIVGTLKSNKQTLEMRYMQTSTIADAIDIVESMSMSDPNYHHYVELKGLVQCDERIVGPFCNREVAYYSNTCYSVSQQSSTVRGGGGSQSTTTKKETVVSSEKSYVPFYMQDASGATRVYIDIESFGKDVDLQQGCDRFESANSDFSRRYQQNTTQSTYPNNLQYERSYACADLFGNRLAFAGGRPPHGRPPGGGRPMGRPTGRPPMGGRPPQRHNPGMMGGMMGGMIAGGMMGGAMAGGGGTRFLGYRLKEDVLFNRQPIYVLGELYRNGDQYYIGRSVVSKKVSKLSYKSEDQLVSDTSKAKWVSLAVGGIIALAGIVFIFMQF